VIITKQVFGQTIHGNELHEPDFSEIGKTASQIAALVDKATPVDADVTIIEDSAAVPANTPKKLSWANTKITLKSYFDTLYSSLTHATRHKAGGADELKLNELGVPVSNIDLNSKKIVSLAEGTAATDAVNKSQLDVKADESLSIAYAIALG